MIVLTFSTVALILLLNYLIGLHNEQYWKKRGVIFLKKNKVLGLFWDFVTGHHALFCYFHKTYKKYQDEPAVAFGSMLTPSLYVKDLSNIHHVTVTDFQSFSHRGFGYVESDKLAHHILFLHGPKWKLLRQNITPLFTTLKLKNMYYIADKSAQDFVNFLKTYPKKMDADVYNSVNYYCCAALGAAVFSMETKSTFESPFLGIVKQALLPTKWNSLKLITSFCSPNLFKFLGLSLFSVQEEYFIRSISRLLEIRQEEGVKKHDFADVCISMKKTGNLKDPDTGFEMKVTDEVLSAQAFFFFLAGLEPCATGTFGALFELGRNPNLLEKVQKEIDDTFAKYNGKLTYDAITNMEYLDKVIKETLRMYPAAPFITRECVKDSVLPIGNIKVEKGTKIYMPIYEIHRDPQYYTNPDIFDPERFSNNADKSDVYMSFGKGNRYCVGARYAILQIKAGVVHILRNFNVKSIVKDGGIMFRRELLLLRLENVDIKLTPRPIQFETY